MNVEDIRKVAVLGAGLLGHGIAQVFAHGGYPVILLDLEQDALDTALARVRRNLDMLVEKEVTTEERAEAAMANISTTTDLAEACAEVDFVTEAVPEILDLKKEMFAQADALCPAHTILASNTSTQRITELASATGRPDRVVGTHWMRSPYIRPLVEIIPGELTSEETVRTATDLIGGLGKVPVLAKDIPAFIVNRLQVGVIREALVLLEEGISREDIDNAWKKQLGLNYCLTGPFEAMDGMGLDTIYLACHYLAAVFDDPAWKPTGTLAELFEAGHYGLKTGKGFYDYSGRSADDIIRERDERLLDLVRYLGIESG